MKYYGKSSQEKLDTCHKDLQKIMNLALNRSAVDISISEGHRPIEEQFELFKRGRILKNGKWEIVDEDVVVTKVDGYDIKSKHNLTPSKAVDVMAYHPNKETRIKIAWNKIHLIYIGAIAICCAQELYDKGEITHLLRSGANWDKDGVIDFDQSFDDYPHLEIYKP